MGTPVGLGKKNQAARADPLLTRGRRSPLAMGVPDGLCDDSQAQIASKPGNLALPACSPAEAIAFEKTGPTKTFVFNYNLRMCDGFRVRELVE